MTIQLALIVLITLLLGYVVLLHIRIAQKNIFIETTVKRLSGIEKSRSMDEMMILLQEIQKIRQFSSFFADKFPDESTISFILENDKDFKIFMHYTKEESDARSILTDGFRFVDSFYKTALSVSSDKLDLVMKHNSRKFFGEYLIIICISNDIINFYSAELEKAGVSTCTFENVLTEAPPLKNENSDIVYQLAHQFIKGYVNHRTGEIVKNPAFDPYYNSETFSGNIDFLKNSLKSYNYI